jgi:glycosyltransferase involved in cell wall biosynthesis
MGADLFTEFSVNVFDCEFFDNAGNQKGIAVDQFLAGYRNGGTHFLGRSLVGCYAAALAGMPTCLEQHAPVRGTNRAIASDLFRQPSFRGLIVISDALAKHYLQHYPHLDGKIFVVRDAADPPPPTLRKFDFVMSNPDALQVGYAGHLYSGKGAEVIVELAKRMPHVMFHVLGGVESDVTERSRQSGDLGNLHFYGHQSHARVSSFLQGLDIGLLPCLRRVLGHGGVEVANWMSPLKLFEYMAHGLPIVSSNLPVLREVLVDGSNALLCDPDDIESWTSAITRLQDDKLLRQQLSRRAKDDFEQNYTWEIRAAKVLAPLLS